MWINNVGLLVNLLVEFDVVVLEELVVCLRYVWIGFGDDVMYVGYVCFWIDCGLCVVYVGVYLVGM